MVALQFEQHCANKTKHTAQRVCVCVYVWLSTCVCVCLQLNGANGRVAAIGSSAFPREHCLYMQRLVLICLPAVFKPLLHHAPHVATRHVFCLRKSVFCVQYMLIR